MHTLHHMTKNELRVEAEASWGTRVFRARRELGLNVREAAERAGVHHSTMVRVEGNEIVPRFRTQLAIATALGKTVDELFPTSSHPHRMRRVA